MDNQEINNGRRRFLTLATCGAGGVAALGVATPFVASFFPSEKAKAAGAAVEVDVSKIEAGQMLTAEWQGKPIWLVNRTDQQLKDLKSLDGAVTDPNSEVDQQPEYAKNEHRSIKPNLLVAIGICTHLGCSPTYRPDIAPATWRRLEGVPLLPRFEIRHCRPSIQRCSCTDQLGCTALQISERYNCFGGRRLKIRNDNYGKPTNSKAKALLGWMDARFPLSKNVE